MRRAVAALALAVAALGGYATSVAAQSADAPPRIAFLARADNPVDALAASAVAGQLGGVVLLTGSDRLGDDARSALVAFAPDLVVLAGGSVALTEQVRAGVAELGLETRRVGGATRTATAALLVALLDEFDPAFLAVDGTARRADEAGRAGIADRADAADVATTAMTADRARVASSADTAGRAELATTALTADRAGEADSATRAELATTALTADRAGEADSAARAGDADRVNGLQASDLSRVAFTSDSEPLTGELNDDVVLSTTITAPTAGFLVLRGSAEMDNPGTTDAVGCAVRVPDLPVDQTDSGAGLRLGGNSDIGHQGTCATSFVLEVPAGEHTVALLATTNHSGSFVRNRTLSVEFVPFGNAGDPPG